MADVKISKFNAPSKVGKWENCGKAVGVCGSSGGPTSVPKEQVFGKTGKNTKMGKGK